MACKRMSSVFALVAVGILSGCASATVQSAKAPEYNKTPTRLAIVVDLGKENSDDLGLNLPGKVKTSLAACGIESAVEQATDLSFGPQKIAFPNPDTLLTIHWKTATGNAAGVIEAEYHFELYDIAGKKVVWKANMDLKRGRGGDLAEVFTKGMMMRLKADGILPGSCAIPA